MFHHFRSRGGWPRRYAYGYAACYASPEHHEQDRQRERDGSRYESRRHGRGRSGRSGVRRPLRYLSYHLGLDEDQMRRVAVTLDTLKMEREQARLDESRTVSSLADLVRKDDVSVDDLKQALAPRVDSAQRLQLAIARAVLEIKDVLDTEQREEFSYLLSNRTIVL